MSDFRCHLCGHPDEDDLKIVMVPGPEKYDQMLVCDDCRRAGFVPASELDDRERNGETA